MKKTDPNKVKVGHLMAFVNYVKVKSITSSGLDLLTEDLNGKEIRIKGQDLIEHSFSADQYDEEQKVSKTDCAKVLISSFNRPLTVCFVKADGSKRTLRGRFIKHEELFGRSMVEDLDKTDKGDKIKQVDHRGLLWLVVDNVKYTVK